MIVDAVNIFSGAVQKGADVILRIIFSRNSFQFVNAFHFKAVVKSYLMTSSNKIEFIAIKNMLCI